jgi:Cu+-exporting ATPase
VGNSRLLEDVGATAGDLANQAGQLRAGGQTVMFVAIDRKTAGLLGVTDPINTTTAEAIEFVASRGYSHWYADRQ